MTQRNNMRFEGGVALVSSLIPELLFNVCVVDVHLTDSNNRFCLKNNASYERRCKTPKKPLE